MSPELNIREKQEVAVGAAESTHDQAMFSPVVDIWETDEGLRLVADLPGVTPEDLSVDLSGGTLTISGRVPAPPAGRKALLTEYEVGTFYRQFALSEGLDQSGITAALKDGVLELTLPRLAPTQPRKIEIKTF
ncbi:MAG: Hsp20/alpha crystallin family protein [Candidatus Adiutrix sp.]|jgi:HSP20 family protein|nr:Hsp20/alpha crystallin family protein [Candidatus Adiutrix sp.]